MCLLTFSYQSHPDYPLIFIGNRDESYRRPSIGAHFWFDAPDVLAGRDLEAGGTWLGLTKHGRFIAITNQPFTDHKPVEMKSRGTILQRFLTEDVPVADFTDWLQAEREHFEGYHLLYGSLADLYFYENVADTAFRYSPGIHSISNTQDDLSNFRMSQSSQLLEDLSQKTFTVDDLLALFQDETPHPNPTDYPDVLSAEVVQNNSAIFIRGNDDFGTVGTTAIVVDRAGHVMFKEVRYNPVQATESVTHEFTLERK